MLQLVHHSMFQHSTARLALLPQAETKCEAEKFLRKAADIALSND